MGKEETFAGAMRTICAMFKQEPSKILLDAYWLALSRLTEDEISTAFSRALGECKFMPVASELLAFAGKARNLTAEAATAWEAVRRAIQRHDYTVGTIDFGPLVNTVLRCMGTWEWLCDQGSDDMVWRQKDFERFYLAFAAGDAAALRPEPLRGWGFNRAGGEDVRIAINGVMPPRQITAPPNPVSDVVRELAEAKSQPGAAVDSRPVKPPAAGSHDSAAASSPVGIPPRPNARVATGPITEDEKAAAVARIAAQLAGRAAENVEVPEFLKP